VTNTTSTPSPEPAKQLTHKELFLALSGIALACVIAAFDSTIISTILPQVAQTLNGMSLYAWVGTGYFLSCSVSILIFGRLGDLYGRKPLLLLSLVLVSLASACSGLSQNMWQLIAFRILQGVGGGMMIATAFAAPADLFPDPKERVRWMVMLSSTFAVASGVGPVLGGVVTQTFGWRAAFFLIPMIGCIAMFVIWKCFPFMKPRRKEVFKFDWLGMILLSITIASPLVGLELLTQKSMTMPYWASVGLILLSFITAILLVQVEKSALTPMFPLRVLESLQSKYLNIAAMIAGAIMFMLVYYIPLQAQDVFGYSPADAGLMVSPLVAGIPVGSVINGRLFQREPNPQRLMRFGGILLGIGCVLVLMLSETTPVWLALVIMGICGLGLGFLIPNLTLFMQIISKREDVGMASALVQTTRALGSAIGTAVVGALIGELSIRTGLQIGLVSSVALCGVVVWLSNRIRMESYTRN